MKNNSPTEVGPTANAESQTDTKKIDAINQVFALFKLNYHNQFFRAFSQSSDLNSIKRLWLDALGHYSEETIVRAAHAIVKTSEFLPTLKTMLSECDRCMNNSLPDARSAYAEACCAVSPKVEQTWRHPAVYLAGKEVGWHFLQSNPENVAYPVFKSAYDALLERSRRGEDLHYEIPEKLNAPVKETASEATSKKYLSNLQRLLND